MAEFALIRDLPYLYSAFSLKHRFVEDRLESFRIRVNALLEAAVGEVLCLEVSDLQTRARACVREDLFLVALDGGILFPEYDYSIEVTRSCGALSDALEGSFMRLARQFSPGLNQQALNLKARFDTSGKRAILLADDGLGTGATFRRIVALCKDLSLPVDRIVCFTNPKAVQYIGDTKVITLLPELGDSPWLNERDLFWGIPRSGVSIANQDSFVAIGGVPYVLNEAMAKSRIEVPLTTSRAFVEAALEVNRDFYLAHEQAHGRTIHFSEVPRLLPLFERGAFTHDRVVDELGHLLDSISYRNSFFSRGAQEQGEAL